MNQKVSFLILCIIFPLFISCSDMLSEYTGQGGGLPPSTGDVRITNAAGLSHWPILAWAGTEYGVVWLDYRDGKAGIFFARINSKGNKQGSDIHIVDYTNSYDWPSLVWTGKEYGLAWDDTRDGNDEIYFTRISPAGITQDSVVRITNATGNSNRPALVWTGTEYGLAWQDNRNGRTEIFFTRISAQGVKQGSDERITFTSANSYRPSLVWTGTKYEAAWYDNRHGNNEIYFANINSEGVKQGPDIRITNGASGLLDQSLVWTGTEYGVAWDDTREVTYKVYFARVDSAGVKQGADLHISDSTLQSFFQTLVWTGTGYGAAWQDNRDGKYGIYWTCLDTLGVKQVPDVFITYDSDNLYRPSLVWTGKEYGVAWSDTRDGDSEIYFARLYPDGTKK